MNINSISLKIVFTAFLASIFSSCAPVAYQDNYKKNSSLGNNVLPILATAAVVGGIAYTIDQHNDRKDYRHPHHNNNSHRPRPVIVKPPVRHTRPPVRVYTPVRNTRHPVRTNTPVRSTRPPVRTNTPVRNTRPPVRTNTPVRNTKPPRRSTPSTQTTTTSSSPNDLTETRSRVLEQANRSRDLSQVNARTSR